MKKIVSMILAVAFMISMASVASAGTKIKNGNSDGGSAGVTSCTGELHYYNSSNPGEDYAYAETASIKSGKLGALATIYYNGTSTAKSAVKNGATSATTAKAYAGDNYQATKAVGSHTYNSDEYGKWSVSITYYY